MLFQLHKTLNVGIVKSFTVARLGYEVVPVSCRQTKDALSSVKFAFSAGSLIKNLSEMGLRTPPGSMLVQCI